eukprot:CAMPEP_0203663746 /NCGR_PEP_ID=MMETSP0090-20130426/1280_1 /ASSEMBLY_ACC=CAM_ASM_001088 /TAXON_ID=426623 /ORGANISM="Chaetoceros affinis, Strain CCMP159" /LENGTH=485 /DNA_ID=CAMNT_0050526749 /DNA_START=215 /DNA_END=1669 /DNA_ORIENTATION=-
MSVYHPNASADEEGFFESMAMTPEDDEFHDTYETHASDESTEGGIGAYKPLDLDNALGDLHKDESFEDDDEALLFNDTSSGYGFNHGGSERDTNTQGSVVTDGTLKHDIDIDIDDLNDEGSDDDSEKSIKTFSSCATSNPDIEVDAEGLIEQINKSGFKDSSHSDSSSASYATSNGDSMYGDMSFEASGHGDDGDDDDSEDSYATSQGNSTVKDEIKSIGRFDSMESIDSIASSGSSSEEDYSLAESDFDAFGSPAQSASKSISDFSGEGNSNVRKPSKIEVEASMKRISSAGGSLAIGNFDWEKSSGENDSKSKSKSQSREGLSSASKLTASLANEHEGVDLVLSVKDPLLARGLDVINSSGESDSTKGSKSTGSGVDLVLSVKDPVLVEGFDYSMTTEDDETETEDESMKRKNLNLQPQKTITAVSAFEKASVAFASSRRKRKEAEEEAEAKAKEKAEARAKKQASKARKEAEAKAKKEAEAK